jgi:hypothetical protein
MTDTREGVLAFLEGGKEQKSWVKRHLDYNDECCLIWPFASPQGATVQIQSVNVFRLMCTYRNGPAPTPKHQAAHSCGRRHDACVNPSHLSWKTNSENQIERYQQSGLTKRSKLTPEQVEEIRSLEGKAPIIDIAKQYGVSSNNVRSIFAGRLWKNPKTSQRHVFNDYEVNMIRTTPLTEKPTVKWAKEFGVHRAVIDRIRRGDTYKWVQQ